MGWTAEIHQGGAHALLMRCSDCGRACYDFAKLPTGDRLCLACVCAELAKAEDEIDVDRARRLEGPRRPS
jgi:hypothetical protein